MMLKKFFFSFRKQKKIYYIDDFSEKNSVIERLSFQKILSVDTEFVWRNTYYPNLSLIQISSKKEIFLIDFLKFNKRDFFQSIFKNIDLLVFHALRSDLMVLSSALGLKLSNVYDTQIAEKIISGGENQSYSSLVEKYFPVNLKKTETNSNWLKRPLSKKQIKYAAEDVDYLIDIYAKQKKILDFKNEYEKALNQSYAEAQLGNQEFYVSRLAKLNSSTELEKKIFMWREKLAMKKNIPSSYIFKDKLLKKIYLSFIQGNKNSNLRKVLKNQELVDSLEEYIQK